MQDVHYILLYCNTDVVIIKPITGRVSTCSASLTTTNCLRFSYRKRTLSTFTFQWSGSGSHNTHNTLRYIALCKSVLNCIALHCIAILLHIAILWQLYLAHSQITSSITENLFPIHTVICDTT